MYSLMSSTSRERKKKQGHSVNILDFSLRNPDIKLEPKPWHCWTCWVLTNNSTVRRVDSCYSCVNCIWTKFEFVTRKVAQPYNQAVVAKQHNVFTQEYKRSSWHLLRDQTSGPLTFTRNNLIDYRKTSGVKKTQLWVQTMLPCYHREHRWIQSHPREQWSVSTSSGFCVYRLTGRAYRDSRQSHHYCQ